MDYMDRNHMDKTQGDLNNVRSCSLEHIGWGLTTRKKQFNQYSKAWLKESRLVSGVPPWVLAFILIVQ